MSVLSQPHFHNEVAAIARLEEIVWPNGPHCPRCGGFDRITKVKGARVGLRRCGPCKREFSVTVGTLFHRSHIKLHLWFQAAHSMASSKKGISAHQLHRTLKVTYKTAWFMEHRLRDAMREGHFVMGGEGKTVEIDETFVGGLEKNKHRSDRKHLGTGGTGKEAVFSLVERGGFVRSHHVHRSRQRRYYNRRAALGVDDLARADDAIRGIVGKRLMYKDSSPASISGHAN